MILQPGLTVAREARPLSLIVRQARLTSNRVELFDSESKP